MTFNYELCGCGVWKRQLIEHFLDLPHFLVTFVKRGITAVSTQKKRRKKNSNIFEGEYEITNETYERTTKLISVISFFYYYLFFLLLLLFFCRDVDYAPSHADLCQLIQPITTQGKPYSISPSSSHPLVTVRYDLIAIKLSMSNTQQWSADRQWPLSELIHHSISQFNRFIWFNSDWLTSIDLY